MFLLFLFLFCNGCTSDFKHCESIYTQKFLHKEVFIQRGFIAQNSFHTQKLLRRETFTRSSFYTQMIWHKAASTHDTLTHRRLYTEQLLQRNFCRQKLLHRQTLAHRRLYAQNFYIDAHRSFYRETLLHTRKRLYAQIPFYTQKLLHINGFTGQRGAADSPSNGQGLREGTALERGIQSTSSNKITKSRKEDDRDKRQQS
jgi:hypothetical protein